MTGGDTRSPLTPLEVTVEDTGALLGFLLTGPGGFRVALERGTETDTRPRGAVLTVRDGLDEASVQLGPWECQDLAEALRQVADGEDG